MFKGVCHLQGPLIISIIEQQVTSEHYVGICVWASKMRLACFHVEQSATDFLLCLCERKTKRPDFLNAYNCFFHKIVKFDCIKIEYVIFIKPYKQIGFYGWFWWGTRRGWRLALACILVGEYLEGKEERPKFYARERIAWEHHISELAAEGNVAFQRLYRMD